MKRSLPEEFEDLEALVPYWTKDTEAARNAFRVSCSIKELREFYDIVMPRLDALAERLEQTTLDNMSKEEASLLELALMAMEVAPAVEYYNQPDVPNSVDVEVLKILPVDRAYKITGGIKSV